VSKNRRKAAKERSLFFSFLELGAIIVVFQLGNFGLLTKRKWGFVRKEEKEWKRR